MTKTMQQALETVEVAQMETPVQMEAVLSCLTGEQLGALEKKYSMLPVEIQESMRARFPNVSNPATLYLIRQSVREANNFLASKLRAGWIAQLVTFVPDLTNSVEPTRKSSEHRIRNLADEIEDVKEVVKTLKAVKVKLDRSSKSPDILAACTIFGISPSTIA